MISTTAPAAPTIGARVRSGFATLGLVPAFLVALALGVFERPMTWPRAIRIGVVCGLVLLALVLLTGCTPKPSTRWALPR